MFPAESLINILDFFLDSTEIDLTYKLFKNDVTVDEDTVLGDFTEADFGGYAAKAAEDEAEPTINGSDEAQSLGAELEWVKTGAPEAVQQIYGCYVTWIDEGAVERLFAAFELPAPVAIAVAGNNVKIKVDWYTKNFVP